MARTFAIYTLGCKVNQEEGAALAALFCAAGYEKVDFTAEADLYIINTCTVTHVADRKCRAMIRRAVKRNPQALVAVAGCYAQVAPAEVAALSGVDLVVGVDERAQLPQLVAARLAARPAPAQVAVGEVAAARRFVPIGSGPGGQTRVRAYLKIEDGCDQFCNYCLVPYARGPVRSLPPEEALAQAAALIASGHREIVLSGIHIGAYGQDLPGVDLCTLIRELVRLPGAWRLRLGSIEPQQFTEELIALVAAQPRICPHLHIPLQSGCDRTLQEMGRRYDTAYYRQLAARLRQARPGMALTSDLLVGYPGESAADFAATAAFCQELAFADLHVFPYSPRRGTPAAARSDQVASPLKEERAAQLGAAARQMQLAYARSWVGASLEMLPEQPVEIDGRAYWQGHSENYLPLLLPVELGRRGQLTSVTLDEAGEEGFFCTLAGKSDRQGE